MSDDIINPDTGEIASKLRQDHEFRAHGSIFWAAFIKAQAVMESPKRTKTAKVRTRDGGPGYEFSYAPLDEIFAVARKPLADNGLCVYQEVERENIRTTLFHSSGECVSSTYPIINGPNPTAQIFGGAVTYARRYGLMLALGIAAEEDDDGNIANQNQREIVDRGQQQQQPPARGRPQVVQTQQSDPIRAKAVETRNKVRAAIDKATTVEQLNKAWTPDDQRAVEAYVDGNNKIGANVWKTLMDEEAVKRLKIVAADEAENRNDPLDEFLSEDDVGNALR